MFTDALAAVVEIYEDLGRALPLNLCVADAKLPDWGSRDLKVGTLRSALRQLGIDWDVFNKT